MFKVITAHSIKKSNNRERYTMKSESILYTTSTKFTTKKKIKLSLNV